MNTALLLSSILYYFICKYKHAQNESWEYIVGCENLKYVFYSIFFRLKYHYYRKDNWDNEVYEKEHKEWEVEKEKFETKGRNVSGRPCNTQCASEPHCLLSYQC